ncbi:LysR family transcriptional regulator [Paenibacillus darwinianus]|uniref:LysR family transcriptional regulator n=1 Tax=Paenibacillus darwinianus TaxID=1380763 RepID=A0A9W5S2E2_9BACL|nr:LysR family transcriptional regulator [Paenibacillus darwinianus]EXX85825.1 LysR family transcriptional regulator [Paenibacillus darwinianus]EXX89232.1 LysR family transcriptional regulator [Paenibacillus darwinianus]EXX90031.1 LysR family transcriptional regulator [Paenibacillus darwinianus]
MLEELHFFATVVEQSSLNKASTLLNLSQPALSRKLAKLEEDLGVLLFRRVGKRLELTRVGQLTYDYALETRRRHFRFLQTISGDGAPGRTSILIGASLTTLQTTLPDLIQMMTESHPEVDIKAVTGKTHEIVSLVRDSKADIGIVASRIDDPALFCVPLFDDHLELALPRGHYVTDAAPGAMSIADLNGLPMILFAKGTWYRILTDELFAKYELKPDVRMEIDSFEAILRLMHTCRAGTLLPKSYIRDRLLEDNDLTVVPVRELEETKRTTSLIHPGPDRMNPSVKLWVEAIAAFFARGK